MYNLVGIAMLERIFWRRILGAYFDIDYCLTIYANKIVRRNQIMTRICMLNCAPIYVFFSAGVINDRIV